MNAPADPVGPDSISRRRFVRSCAIGAAALASAPALRIAQTGADAAGLPASPGPAVRTIRFDQDWLFGGKFNPAALANTFDDAAFERVDLPHCVARLSWQNWDPAAWENVWIYRKHFTVPPAWRGLRVFLHFDGVMVATTPTINGSTLPRYLGGYLPSRYEITRHLVEGENVLAVQVDSRCSDVPPEGSPKGPRRVDYLEAGGIYRSVRLTAVPSIFIRDVFAKPVNVLDPTRRVEVICTLDAAAPAARPVRVLAQLRADRLDGGGEVHLRLSGPGELVGDNPCSLAETGGVGAVWIRAHAGAGGRIEVTAAHSTLGARSLAIQARAAVA